MFEVFVDSTSMVYEVFEGGLTRVNKPSPPALAVGTKGDTGKMGLFQVCLVVAHPPISLSPLSLSLSLSLSSSSSSFIATSLAPYPPRVRMYRLKPLLLALLGNWIFFLFGGFFLGWGVGGTMSA